MSKLIQWIKKYPLTAICLAICFVLAPYFAGQYFFEMQSAYEASLKGTEIHVENSPLSHKAGTELLTLKEAPETETETEAETETEPPEEKKEFHQVDQSYLDDALFIGDSRTEALNLYAGWDNATYYDATGMNIWSCMDAQMGYDPTTGQTVSVDTALQRQSFGKIYIMYGINELGTGTAETFYQQFKSVVERIHELQPEAVIFVQAIIHVSASVDDPNGYINNAAVNARNDWLTELADGESVFYLDANEVLDDGNGCLTGSYTFDGIHLQAQYLDLWKDYILSHGI